MSTAEIISTMNTMGMRDISEIMVAAQKRMIDIRIESDSRIFDAKVQILINTASRVFLEDIMVKGRKDSQVWGRRFVAWRLKEDGYTLTQIANALGQDHSTVSYSIREMEMMQKQGTVGYDDLKEIWKQFNKAI